MLTAAFFANIGYFFAGVYALTVVACIFTRTYTAAFLLTLIELTAWTDSLWYNPGSMAIAHLLILITMALTLNSKNAMLLIYLVLSMVAADMAWVIMQDLNLPENFYQFPYSNFWWQSILNFLFLTMCIVIDRECYTAHKDNGISKGVGNENFYARQVQGH